MSEIAILTPSHKTDTREQSVRMLENTQDRQNEQDRLPRSQFYGLVQAQSIFAIDNNVTWGLLGDKIDTANIDYPAPNFLPNWYSTQSLSVTDLGFENIEKIQLNIFTNWYRRNNVVSFASNFFFDLFCVIAEVSTQNPETLGVNDYVSFLKIKVGTVNYNASNNTFSNIYSKINLDLSKELTPNQYSKLKNGQIRLAVYFGFETSLRTSAELQFMLYRPFINTSIVQLLYKGIAKL